MTQAVVFDRLQAFADPIRGRLLLALEAQELTVREIQSALQLPQSTVSRHLKVLADLGLVVPRGKAGRNPIGAPPRRPAPDLAAVLRFCGRTVGSASRRALWTGLRPARA